MEGDRHLSSFYNNVVFLNDDVIKLCILSTADLEKSFSKLINEQAAEIRLISEYNKLSIQQMTALNNAVKRNIKNIARIHILLLGKLEVITKAVSFDSDKSIGSEPASMYPVSQTAEKRIAKTSFPIGSPHKTTYSPKFVKYIKGRNQALARKHRLYSLKGRGQGVVSNRCDPFYGGIAIVQAGISNSCFNKNEKEFLCYSVIKGIKMQIFIAYPESLKLEYHETANETVLKIVGTGSVLFKERTKPDRCDEGSFVLTICHLESESENNSFEMIIAVKHNNDFNHSTGKMNGECFELSM
jgi:hypothetical protein